MRTHPSLLVFKAFLLSAVIASPINAEEVYWAAPQEAVAAGMERCKKFNSASLDEQLAKLNRKYGEALKNEKILTQDEGSRVLFAERIDPTIGEVKYAYFNSLNACETYQATALKDAIIQPKGGVPADSSPLPDGNEKLLEALGGIKIGTPAADLIKTMNMECSETLCGTTLERKTWVGVIGELNINSRSDRVNAVIARYKSGDLGALLTFMAKVFGKPTVQSRQVMMLKITGFAWHKGVYEYEVLQNSGTDIYGNPPRIPFTLMVHPPSE